MTVYKCKLRFVYFCIKLSTLMNYTDWKEKRLFGRYISAAHLEPVFADFSDQSTTIGLSVLKQPIRLLTFGNGPKKILLWSQMHGNESTTTKALFDAINYFQSQPDLQNSLTLYCIPMLNPDGADAYTRVNANQVDLNRDFLNTSQPETKALLDVYGSVKPDFCFNLHDQRTIFGVGYTGKPATVSFLAPAFNDQCEINAVRQQAISVISAMNNRLQELIPGQIGRFDDTYNRNCVGDTFQTFGTPTILVEAGHFAMDYDREETRMLIFESLIRAFRHINENDFATIDVNEYLSIPENITNYFDFVYKNVKINYDSNEIITNFAVQFEESLIDNRIQFTGKIVEIGTLLNVFGHVEYDAEGKWFSNNEGNTPKIGMLADFYIGSQKFSNGKPDNSN